MELRHLRYFVAVAEELHFQRAAQRLHIEQSPLSRAIKDLEYDLGAQLFERTTRSTRLTWAGQVLLGEARSVLSSIELAKANVRAAANGYHGHLRIGLSDGIAQPRLSALFARCREEEPDVELRLLEMPLAQQIRGLQNGLLDAGFALADRVGEGVIAEPVWADPIAVVLPVGHPLAVNKRVALADALRHPLVLCHPDAGSGCYQQVEALIRSANTTACVADHATTLGVMITMIGAGYGIGFAIASQVAMIQRPDVVARPLSGRTPPMLTYILRPCSDPSAQLLRFIERARLDSPMVAAASLSGMPDL